MANTVYWTNGSGTTVNLDDGTKYKILLGKTNFLSPSISLIEDKVPQAVGSVLRWVNVEPRTLDLPIIVYGTSYTDMLTNLRELGFALDPTLGEGYLEFHLSDGIRRLNCIYTGGFDGNESDNESFVVWSKFVLSFRAFDPYFYSTVPVNLNFSAASTVPFFPFFPMRLSTGSAMLSDDVTNAGNSPAYPTWTLTGPGSAWVVTNNETGKYFILNYDVASGEVITISTDTDNRYATSSTGGNVFGYLAGELWSLEPNTTSTVTVEVTTTGSPTASLEFLDKWVTL